MAERTRRKQDAEEHLKEVRADAEEEAPEAEEERPEDRARRLTPGVGWTRGKDIEDARSRRSAPRSTRTTLDRSGEKKYERAAKDFARSDRKK
jgi:hypothetical protein